MRIAVPRHVDLLDQLLALGIIHVQAAFPVTGSPHLPAVGRQQDMVGLVGPVERVRDAAGRNVDDGDGTAHLMGAFPFVGDPEFGLIRVQRTPVGSDAGPGRPDDLARGEIHLRGSRVGHDRVDIFLRGIDHGPVGPIAGEWKLGNHLPRSWIDLGNPEGTHRQQMPRIHQAHALHARVSAGGIAGRLHHRIDVFVVPVRPHVVEITAHLDVLNAADNGIGSRVIETHAHTLIGVPLEPIEHHQIAEYLPVMEPGADGDLGNRLQCDGVDFQNRPGSERHRRSIRTRFPRAGHVRVLAVGGQHRRMHGRAQSFGHLVARDNLKRFRIAYHELVALRGSISVEQDGWRTGSAHVLIEIGLAGLGFEFRFTRIPGPHDPGLILAEDVAFRGPPGPGRLQGVEPLDRLDLKIAFRFRKLRFDALARLQRLQVRAPPIGQGPVLRQPGQRADVHRDRYKVLVGRIQFGDDHAHDRVALKLVPDVERGRAKVQRGADQSFARLRVADPTADIGM